MSNEKQDRQQSAPPRDAPARPNLAAGVEIPSIQPRRQPDHRRVHRAASVANDQQPDLGHEPGRRQGRAPARRRMQGTEPARNLGERPPLQHEEIVKQAHGLLEMAQKDPDSLDGNFIAIMQLQAMAAYGGQVNEMLAMGEGLKEEITRLRQQVEQYTAADGGAQKPTSVRETRIGRRRGTASAATPASRMRGRRRSA